MKNERPSVFVSYAHTDSKNFAKRLKFSLEMYTDAFLDSNLEAGKMREDLQHEIETRDYFVFIVSPCSIVSEWCRAEFNWATESGRKIVPIKADEVAIKEFQKQNIYKYADFSEDFNRGFRELTQLILGQPYSSWEYLADVEIPKLIESLGAGHIPSVISKEYTNWLLITRVWNELRLTIDFVDLGESFGAPHTIMGMKSMCAYLATEAPKQNDFATPFLVEKLLEYLDDVSNNSRAIKHDDHLGAGVIASNTLKYASDFAIKRYSSELDFRTLSYFHLYELSLYDKLRALIIYYADISRRLY